MIDFGQILIMLSEGPLGFVLYPLYLLLVFLTTYYIALVP